MTCQSLISDRCCAGRQAVRPPAAAAPAPSLAGAVAPRAPNCNSASTRHASSHSRGEQAVLCAKRARSRTFKAGSGHSKGIPLRIPSVPPSESQFLDWPTRRAAIGGGPFLFSFLFLGPVGTLGVPNIIESRKKRNWLAEVARIGVTRMPSFSFSTACP